MYKLVAIDVDGTLLNSKHMLPERNRFVIQKLLDSGIHVALATGKQYITVESLIKTLNLSGPQITNDGALVTLAQSGEIIYRKGVPKELAKQVIDVAQQLHVTLVVSHESKVYATSLNEDTEHMMSYGDPAPKVVRNLWDCLEPLPTHLMIIAYGKDSLYETIAATLQRRFGNRLSIVRSSPYFLEILHPEVSKGNALRKAAQYLKVAEAEIIGFGDGENDISFLSFVGYSVAMGNSRDNVKRYASMITDTCDNDGVAVALESIFPDLFTK